MIAECEDESVTKIVQDRRDYEEMDTVKAAIIRRMEELGVTQAELLRRTAPLDPDRKNVDEADLAKYLGHRKPLSTRRVDVILQVLGLEVVPKKI